ncbi:hypothetical protein [Aquisalimonas asiatica]|uniref:LTXXQ motif family protein n=1 Tax=Aquisalimonas asiatica TaxID=406100 RepID=A0A1H8PKM4_9GAMM|nr:hypothetical protein [Aquisalimonas asiatica]SEO42264.1 hypothetical protein SAMN04488052_1014 [Aquisalimonas asiatica]
MLKRISILIVAVMALAGFTAAKALDDATIDQWLGSMSELQSWAATQDDVDDEFDAPERIDDMDFEAMLAETAREHEEIQTIIRRHGYENEDEWAAAGSRILRATMASEMRMTSGKQEEMEQALREIDEHPQLSDEQKERMRQQIEQQMAAFAGLFEDVPDEDIEAVQRRRDAIMDVMDAD